MASPNEEAAWLLDIGGDMFAAVGRLHLIHLLTAPKLFRVPHGPHYCQRVFIWQDQPLPAMDLALRLSDPHTPQEEEEEALFGVMAFQQSPNQAPQYGGVRLYSAPILIQVSDDQAADLPLHPTGWKELSHACFKYPDYGLIPILNLPVIFSFPAPAK